MYRDFMIHVIVEIGPLQLKHHLEAIQYIQYTVYNFVGLSLCSLSRKLYENGTKVQYCNCLMGLHFQFCRYLARAVVMQFGNINIYTYILSSHLKLKSTPKKSHYTHNRHSGTVNTITNRG